MSGTRDCNRCGGTGIVSGYESDQDCPDCRATGITKFLGETDWDAIVNHHALNIEEEDDFISFLEANGTAPGRCNLWQLQAHYEEWQRLNQNC